MKNHTSEQISIEFWYNRIKEIGGDAPSVQSTKITVQNRSIDVKSSLKDQFRKVGMGNAASEFVIAMAAFQATLTRYNLKDHIITTPGVKREVSDAETERVLCFSNNAGDTFKAQIDDLKKQFQQSVNHKDYDYQNLINTLELNTSLAENDLFQIGFAYSRFNEVSSWQINKFNFILILKEENDKLIVELHYKSDLYDEAFISRFIRHYLNTLEVLLGDVNEHIDQFELLSKKEIEHLVTDFNDTTSGPAIYKNVVALFEQQAENNESRIALSEQDATLTYGDLRKKVGMLTYQLDIVPGDVVAVIANASAVSVTGILSILKAGGIYLPIDPEYPEDRIKFILQDGNVRKAIMDKDDFAEKSYLSEMFADEDLIIISSISEVSGYSFDQEIDYSPDNTAYIIYTSGTTGTPKGVKVSHGALYNYISWASNTYVQGAYGLNFALYTSLAFDLTITSIFTPLTTGNGIVIYDANNKENLIETVINDNKVDILKITPAHLQLIRDLKMSDCRLKCMIVGGENFDTDLAKRIQINFNDDLIIYNEYGPTEATVGCMIHRYNLITDKRKHVPIGKPIDNVQVYILDQELNPVPEGATGELHISGKNLAAGYINQTALTSQRFVDNPFIEGRKMYKTGDLARFISDNIIECLGRVDQQVKVNGYRIELGEVEAELNSFEGIEQAVVKVVQHYDKPKTSAIKFCKKCGLPSNYPEVEFNKHGVCNTCVAFDGYKDQADAYFKTLEDLEHLFKSPRQGDYDCLMLLSGGKDSTYVLYQLVLEMKLKVLVFSLDNGFISEEAKQNIKKVTSDLGVDLVFGSTPHMNKIFKDSLQQHSNVCNGCFKAIYTLGINLARERNIKYIVTGLSRGQIFETRLNELYSEGVFDVEEIDKTIIEARKTYHQLNDAVNEHLDVTAFENENLFEEIQIVDYFRYSKVKLEDMYSYLIQKGWQRPSDTGRSTNCLINDLGIYIHKKERGFHNYALPYSWDVRMGHKTREEALKELDDEIDYSSIQSMLKQVGYNEHAKQAEQHSKSLVAYYTSKSPIRPTALRSYLSKKLPQYMVPNFFVSMVSLPLTVNGKVDRKELPEWSEIKAITGKDYVAPETIEQEIIADAWEHVLKRGKVGINDSFLTIGGDSINAIQIVAKLHEKGYKLTVQQIITKPTIAQLASLLESVNTTVDQSTIHGEGVLGPMEHQFFDYSIDNPNHFNQSVMLSSNKRLESSAVQLLFQKLVDHHDILRAHYRKHDNGWTRYIDKDFHFEPTVYDFKEHFDAAKLKAECDRIQQSFDLQQSPLIKTAIFQLPKEDRLFIVAHHTIIDGISWRIILDDLLLLFDQQNKDESLILPLKTNDFNTWVRALESQAASDNFVTQEELYWKSVVGDDVPAIPRDFEVNSFLYRDVKVQSFKLGKSLTHSLLTEANKAFNTEINDILLCSLLVSINHVFGLDKVKIALESHGREPVPEGLDISRTIGWFTSIYPVVLGLSESKDLFTNLKMVKETIRKVPNKGLGYGILKCLAPQKIKKDIFFEDNISIVFNYLGQIQNLEGSDFKISSDVLSSPISGGFQRPFEWEISGIVIEDQLELSLSYSDKQYKNDTITHFLQGYKDALSVLVTELKQLESGSFTPADFSYKALSFEQLDNLKSKYALENIVKLSSMQQGMLVHHLIEDGSKAYFQQISYQLQGRLDLESIDDTLRELVKRHTILRSVFISDQAEIPLQVVLKSMKIDFHHNNISDLSPILQQETLNTFKHRDEERGFDLANGPLMRVHVFYIGADKFEFIWSYHHIILDGWSAALLISEFFEIYNAKARGQQAKLNGVRPYSDYIEWLNGLDKLASTDYWQNYLIGYDEIATIPRIETTQNTTDYDLGTQTLVISEPLVQSLQKIASKQQITLSVLLQCAWGVLLSKYNSTNDVVFGNVVSGRSPDMKGIDNMIGLFINTVPLRVTYEEGYTFVDILQQAKKSNAENGLNQYLSLTDIQEQSILKGNLFDHILVFENYPTAHDFGNKATSDRHIRVADVSVVDQTIYDFNVIVQFGEEITIRFDYNNLVINAVIAENAVGHYRNILEQIVENPALLVDQLNITSEHELNQFSSQQGTPLLSVEGQSIQEIFQNRVKGQPQLEAVSFQDNTLTYAQLNKKSNQLAQYLRTKHEINRGDLVGMMMIRSEWMLVTILGILKAGAAYVPIDPNYPTDRKKFMIEDANVSFTIINEEADDIDLDYDKLNLDQLWVDVEKCAYEDFSSINLPDDLAYVIYTSGSTGTPKGVMVSHRNLLNLLFHEEFPYDFGSNDVWPLFHSECFDVSVWEIFAALLYGSKLVVISKEMTRDLDSYLNLVVHEGVTVLNFTPTVFFKFYELLQQKNELPALKTRYVIFAGEALKTGTLGWWLDNYPEAKLINMYGITETCIHVTYKEIGYAEIESGINNVGKPLNSHGLYVMDQHLSHLPVGVTGEIVVSGNSVTHGYINREDLTNQRYVNRVDFPKERLYRSGDLAMRLPNGEIVYKGRNDNQVKIRGFRIELGEVQNLIVKHNEIAEAHILLKRDNEGNNILVAYYVSDHGGEVNYLRSYLGEFLPDYMIPSFFVNLKVFPVTSNGKIDYKSLPDHMDAIRHDAVDDGPRDEVEQMLTQVWKKVLGVESIGIKRNFFEVGGNSLKVINVINAVNDLSENKLKVSDMYNYGTIEQLSEIIRSADDQGEDQMEKIKEFEL